MKKIIRNWKPGSAVVLFLAFLMAYACKKDENLKVQQKDPKISSYYPNSGNNGTLVTILGENFIPDIKQYRVTISNIEGEVISADSENIVFRVPSKAKSGKIALFFKNKEIPVGDYTYQDLTISKVSPSNGPAGSHIRIYGLGFGSTENPAMVQINSKEAIVVSASDTLLIVEVPDQAGFGPILVSVDGKESKGQNFTYQEIASIKPLTGGKGTKVLISGIGFEKIKAGNVVDFNGQPATVLEASEENLLVEAPEEVTTGPLSVTINNQKITGPQFTVRPVPLIRKVMPLSAPAGSEVVIEGEFFSTIPEEVVVLFNGKKALISKTSESSISVQVPTQAGNGKIQIAVNDQLTIGPEFKEQNLGITRISPENGLEGDVVTIYGMGFSEQANSNKVRFNGLLATVQSASETELKVLLPQNLSSGNVEIEVGNLQAKGPKFLRAGMITLAGGPRANLFRFPSAIAVDSKGNVYVGDEYRIWKVSPSGTVNPFVGNMEAGAVDANGTSARFGNISGLAMDPSDNLWVADASNQRIRKVSPAGDVSTVAMNTGFKPVSIASDFSGNIYVGHEYTGVYSMNKQSGNLTRVHPHMNAPGNFIAPMSPNKIYYAPEGYDYLRIFQFINGEHSTFMGNGNFGLVDGPSLQAQFFGIHGMAVNREGVVYFIDAFGRVLRKIENGTVTSLAGLQNGQGMMGFVDGSFAKARMNGAKNICFDKDGILYIAESGNKAIRKVFLK